jgi:hypothetical protein
LVFVKKLRILEVGNTEANLMTTIDVLRRRATGLAGCPAPGDARATARVVSDLCDHVSTLQDGVSELLKQMLEARRELEELKKQMNRA